MKLSGLTGLGRKVLPVRYCGAVIVAAGNASRMGGIDKVMAMLKGEPMIVHTVRAFQACDAVREVVVVTRPDLIVPIKDLCSGMDKVCAVVAGGATRAESVMLGMNALSKRVRLAAIQDGARPLVSVQLIDRVIRAAHTYGGAIPGIPVKDTIKTENGGLVDQTPERKTLRAVQTPQVFDFDMLRGALKKAQTAGWEITDDCSAVEKLGMKVKIVEGDERNLKVTTPMDLKIAELLMEEEE